MIPFLPPGAPFPPVHLALDYPNGLLAVGGDLSVETLVRAYGQGVFPWYSEGDPILWWCPDPRMVLPTDRFHVSRSLGRRLARADFRVSFDEAFGDVLRACAAPRGGEPGTWLLPEMREAYHALHEAGLAHSVEVWMDGRLAGGLYGVALGRMFYGESMFSVRSDGSKLALAYLTAHMRHWGMPLIDCQMESAHLGTLGASTLPRRDFVSRLRDLVRQPPPAWSFDPTLVPVTPPAGPRQEP